MSFKIILDEHIGTTPPSTVDVERIMRRERRSRVLRRVTGGGAALAATALAITAGVTLAGGTRLPSGPAASDPAPVTRPSPQVSASPSPAAQAFQPTFRQLQTAIEQALAETAPDARWIYMPDVPGESPLQDGRPEMSVESGEPAGFAARSGLSRRGAKAGFYLWLRPDGCSSRDGGPRTCSLALKCNPGSVPADCTNSTTPGGLSIVEITETSAANGNKRYRFYTVQVGPRNGYHLTLHAVNYFGGDGSAVSVETPLLTKAELKAMALAIAVRISL